MFDRSGTLFACPNDVRREGPFKSILIDSADYLRHMCRYIHRNPIDCAVPLVSSLEKWEYSDYPNWAGFRFNEMFNDEVLKKYFGNSRAYTEFVFEYKLSEKMLKKLKPYFIDFIH